MGALRPVSQPEQVPAALNDLVDAAVVQYAQWARGNPVMLVHAATAPRAMALVLPALPKTLWVARYDMAWAVAAALSVAYRPAGHAWVGPAEIALPVPRDLAAQAVELGDEHAIKLGEVAEESRTRGRPGALMSLVAAVRLISADRSS